MSDPIKLVTFDLDNTLWDVVEVIGAAERKMRTWLEHRAPQAMAHYTPDNMAELRAGVLARRPEAKHDLSSLRTLCLIELFSQQGYSRAQAHRLGTAAFDIFYEARHDVRYFDHALETLETLKTRYTLAALTNGNADFAKLGLDRFFAFGLSSADVGASKPHPAMFNEALARTNVAPTAAVHIGDSLNDDVGGAKQAGMMAIWVNFTDEPHPGDAPKPDATVRSLAELGDALSFIRG